MQEWLTTTELAKLAGAKQARIRRIILEGRLEAEKRGRDWFIAQDEAHRWLAGHNPRKSVAH